MSLNFGEWLAGGSGIVQGQWPLRAQIKWARILNMPTAVQFLREGIRLDEQIVSIEFENAFSNADSEVGSATLRKGTLHGLRGHPEINDLDVERWDTFVLDNIEFTIAAVNKQMIGEVQADFEAVV